MRQTLAVRLGKPDASLVLLGIGLLAHTTATLARFSSRLVDDDQALMWYAAQEVLAGRLHEPRFYGQSYGTMLEAWLGALPLAAGLPLEWALPLASALLLLITFLVTAMAIRRQGATVTAAACLAYPLLAPQEYTAVALMPRGFMPAVATGALVVRLILSRPVATIGSGRLMLYGLGAGLALSMHPTAGYLLLPFTVWLWLQLVGQQRGCLVGGAGMAAAVHACGVAFYASRPHSTFFNASGGSVSWSSLWRGLTHMDDQWNAVVPIAGGWLLPTGLLIAAWRFHRTACRGERNAVLVAVALLIGSLATAKAHDGTSYLFYHHCRLYLAVPVLVAVVGLWIELNCRASVERRRQIVWALVAVTMLVAIRKQTGFATWRQAVLKRRVYGVGSLPVADARRVCDSLALTAERQGVALVVFGEDHRCFAYACGAILHGQVETLLSARERRSWRLQEESRSGGRRFLLHSSKRELIRRARKAGVRLRRLASDENLPLYLVDDPERPPVATLKALGYEFRPF